VTVVLANAVTWGADVSAFMGGFGTGLACLFLALLFVGGVSIFRRVTGL
jgi:hypothetical protein